MDCRVQPRHQFLIAFAKFTESLCLGSKKVRNSVRILAGFELCSKGMCFEGFSGYGLIFVFGGIEYCGKVICGRASYWIVRGHRDREGILGNAQVVYEDGWWE